MEKLENSTDCKGTVSPLNNSGSALNSTVSRHEALGFVLVHAGAGYHSESKAKEYKHVCKRACQRDSPFTNAGTGSNLNLSGEIECDASIMDGKSLNYGAVGALSGIKNPVLVARRLLSETQKGKLSAGRIPPCFLVGKGAEQWAISHGIPACPTEKMTTKFSLSGYKRNKRKMELAEQVETKRRRQSCGHENDLGCLEPVGDIMVEGEENNSACLDTVGAVVVDREGNVAAAVSSGGLAMKHPGRVGQAAHYGCGCWAENARDVSLYSTAVSTSGSGEHLIRTMLARECSTSMQTENAHQALLEAMQNKFISSPFLAGEDCVLGGVIVLRCCTCGEAQRSEDIQALLVEFLWSHTTESMCVGYMSAQDSKPRTHISRLPPGAVAGQSLAIEGGVCRLGTVSD
ncbi:threonine aspartase 1 isoform X2 [Rhinichthys klamathensis goyatoka]|uniref:threonine aspartase 1 isoform X2 n=1 Tax=Rhinichthys klamathensis goyatoka TaxID=3034132 RepID=UPI0024B5095F|nr:threonine aspartase 1 isoform X2 [Rhinichthys klamathensis goyatoka]